MPRTNMHHFFASSSRVKAASSTFCVSVHGNTSKNFSVPNTQASAFNGSILPWNKGGFIFLNSLVRAMVLSSFWWSGTYGTCNGSGDDGCCCCCCLRLSAISRIILFIQSRQLEVDSSCSFPFVLTIIYMKLVSWQIHCTHKHIHILISK